MNTQTIEALKASIAKWERNAEAKRPYEFKIYAEDCPLCVLFNNGMNECNCCPVFEKTRWKFCKETPYISAVTALRNWIYANAPADRAHAAARDEVAFLKSLLPEETP